jgi:hypothetical protein
VVEVTVLTVPQCPNATLVEERLAVAAAGIGGVRVIRRLVHDEREAVALGMSGSPTLLISGTDPFAAAGAPASLSCRLYRQADGSLAGAPPADALRLALIGAGQAGHG